MYRTRDAASSWEARYTEVLTQGGFVQGKFSPCVFKKGEVVATAHGDDFTMTGPEEALRTAEELIKRKFDAKIHDLKATEIGKAIIILNRRLVATEEGYAYEPDVKHSRGIRKELGLDVASSKGSWLIGTKATMGGNLVQREPT